MLFGYFLSIYVQGRVVTVIVIAVEHDDAAVLVDDDKRPKEE